MATECWRLDTFNFLANDGGAPPDGGDSNLAIVTVNVSANDQVPRVQFLVNDANPQSIIDGYALLGARATLNGPDERWSVSLFANNLLNKQYEAGNLYQFLGASLGLGNGVFPGSMAVRRLHGDPRTYGLSGTFRF